MHPHQGLRALQEAGGRSQLRREPPDPCNAWAEAPAVWSLGLRGAVSRPPRHRLSCCLALRAPASQQLQGRFSALSFGALETGLSGPPHGLPSCPRRAEGRGQAQAPAYRGAHMPICPKARWPRAPSPPLTPQCLLLPAPLPSQGTSQGTGSSCRQPVTARRRLPKPQGPAPRLRGGHPKEGTQLSSTFPCLWVQAPALSLQPAPPQAAPSFWGGRGSQWATRERAEVSGGVRPGLG